MQAAVQEKMLQQREHMQEQQRRLEEKRASRKKTAKQLEKEARQQEEEKNLSKSIQEVFRKLAAALHPDREQDTQEKERKTKIMQQVNVAYAKKDLLRLLELQLEFEHIDQAHLNNIAADRLKYFNKILQEQLVELEQEITQIEMPFKMQLQMSPFLKLTPTKLLAQLEFDIKDVQHDISRLEADLARFQVPANLKAWLKTYSIPKKTSNPLDDFFLE
jgi:chromosome segregation ATPase